MTDPQPDFCPLPGTPEDLAPELRRIVAPNPSAMTFRGTNTYLLGRHEIAVIDPGPELPQHLEAILAALQPGQSISHIFVTHAHLDHSPLARALSGATGAPVLAFGDASAGRSPRMQGLAAADVGGGEGVDAGFAPDVPLADGSSVRGDGWTLEALHTPGHFGNHLCFAWGDRLFTGDLVMGWSSSLVSPPDGDLTDFMTSLERLSARDWSLFHPGHGAAVTRPQERLSELLTHRRTRERQILDALRDGPQSCEDLAARIYAGLPPALLPAAARNVLAHLIDLETRGLIAAPSGISKNAAFEVV